MTAILLVEDDEDVASTTSELLGLEGFKPTIAKTITDATRLLTRGPLPACVVTDLGLPDGDAEALLLDLCARRVQVPVILLTGSMRGADVARAFGIGMVMKPYEIEVLVAAIQVALDNRVFPSPPRRPRLPTRAR